MRGGSPAEFACTSAVPQPELTEGELLVGGGVVPDDLNDDAMGRALHNLLSIPHGGSPPSPQGGERRLVHHSGTGFTGGCGSDSDSLMLDEGPSGIAITEG